MPPEMPTRLTQYSGPSNSSSSSSSETYDYSGLDDAVQKQDQVGALRAQKFGLLYGGDVAGSVQAAHQIRSLLDALRPYAADVSEARPRAVVAPLSRLSSRSSSVEAKSDSGGWAGSHDDGYGSKGRG